MNKLYIKLLCILPLCAPMMHAITPYYSIRSQSVDAARELVGWTHKINLFDKESFYGTFALTLEGTGSFNSSRIGCCLFGAGCDDCCPRSLVSTCLTFNPAEQPCTAPACGSSCDGTVIGISGSRVSNRASNDWLADYFGLSTTYQSTVTLKPAVHNFIADLNLYLGLDEWLFGSYFRIHAPIVWTKWNLNACETAGSSTDLLGYDAGYFGPTAVSANALLKNATTFFSGCGGAPILGTPTFQSLQYAKWNCEGKTQWGVAEIQMALGWNLFLDSCYHFGINFRAYAPTGNRPTGEYLFEPIVGNGKHWEVGAGFTFHYTLWQTKEEDESLGLYIDGNFTSQLAARQKRTFDIVGRPLSRYMLAEKMGPLSGTNYLFANANPGDQLGSTPPSAQFADVFTPVANLTTVDVKVSSAIQIDVVALLNYTHCNFEFDFGYNYWSRSCEKIDLDCHDCTSTPLSDGNTWAFKGDSHVYGFASPAQMGMVLPNDTPVRLSATQSNATINSGTNNFTDATGDNTGIGGIRPTRNPGVDNARYARLTNINTVGANINDRTVAGEQTKTSLNPVFLKEVDLDLMAARTKGYSNKVFAHLSYTWRERCLEPYVGVGGKAEFAGKGSSNSNCGTTGLQNCNPFTPTCSGGGEGCSGAAVSLPTCSDSNSSPCASCQICNLSEWGVWIKGGVSF